MSYVPDSYVPEPPIGIITYADGSMTATLWGTDEWVVEHHGTIDPILSRWLDIRYRGQYQGPAYGYYGQALLQVAAKDLGGTITQIQDFPDRPSDPDIDY
jgi:hypothetical protein